MMTGPLITLDQDSAWEIRRRYQETMIEGTFLFRRAWLAERGWDVLLEEDELCFPDAERMSAVASRAGAIAGTALGTENQKNLEAYEFPITTEALYEVSSRFALQHYLIVLHPRILAVASDGDYFFSVAGPRPILTSLAGKSLPEARTEFRDYAEWERWSEQDKQFLAGLMARFFVEEE